MILGRNPALWLALVTASLNVAVVVFGIPLDAQQVAALDALAIAGIGLLANSSDPTTVPTFAMTLRDRRLRPAGLPSAMGSSIGTRTSSIGSAGAGRGTPTDAGPHRRRDDWRT